MKEVNSENNRKKLISILIPCYNEENNIPVMIKAINEQMTLTPYDHEIIFIDDGSSDQSINVLKETAKVNNRIFFMELSRNFGHQQALKAGLDYARGDCVISMDSDMQHPPYVMLQLLKEWENGCDIVYTRRLEGINNKKTLFSKLFYKTINILSDTKMENGASDFRLLDRAVVNVITELKEYNPFFRGLVKWVGFKQICVKYHPEKRHSGKSKYSLKKMIGLALEGITSFSIRPLYLAVYLGFTLSFISLLYIPYVIFSLIYEHPISGWASIIVTIAFFGGIQLCVLGIIGIYIGKLFIQSKQRPNYIIRNTNLVPCRNDSLIF